MELRGNRLTTGTPGKGRFLALVVLTEFLLQTSFFKVPWGNKMNKCGHVPYLEGLPMMKTRDAQLCQVEQMSG